MKKTVLLGWCDGALADIRDQLERSLGITFVLHESTYRGGDYFRFENDAIQMILQHNRELGNELAEEDFPEATILLYATALAHCAVSDLQSLSDVPGARVLKES